MRVVIVDDEPLALNRLAHQLSQVGGVEVVAQIDDPQLAVAKIVNLRPDLVLLDVEMPKVDGFDIADALIEQAAGGDGPLIAFVTAYPQYALEAFDTGVLDFVCKPVRIRRLAATIDRARTAIALNDASRRLCDLRRNLGELREASGHVELGHFWVRNRGDLIKIQIQDVLWVEAQGNYSLLHLQNRSHLVRRSIGVIADELASDEFLRVHKSAIVNRARIEGLQSSAGRIRIVLDNGSQVRVGRTYREAVRHLAD